MKKHIMFINSCYTGSIVDIDNELVEKEIKEIFKESIAEKSVKKSNQGGWQSPDLTNFHVDQFKETQKIINVLFSEVNQLYHELKINDVQSTVTLSNMWININNKGDFNWPHTHPNSILSAVYYVKHPKGSGNLIFERPDLQKHYFRPTTVVDDTYMTWHYTPVPKAYIFFPSYLSHFVEPNELEAERISIAFNFC